MIQVVPGAMATKGASVGLGLVLYV